ISNPSLTTSSSNTSNATCSGSPALPSLVRAPITNGVTHAGQRRRFPGGPTVIRKRPLHPGQTTILPPELSPRTRRHSSTPVNHRANVQQHEDVFNKNHKAKDAGECTKDAPTDTHHDV